MRKLIFILLCILLIASFAPTMAEEGEEQSAPEEFAWGDWVYYLNGDGTACLSRFAGPSDIRTIDIPTEVDGHPVTVIDGSCMSYLFQLRELVIPEGITEIGDYALGSVDQLEKVSLPSTLRIIGSCCFQNDFFLDEVVIPDGVIEIGEGAFGGCPLTRLTISSDHPAVEMEDGVMVDRKTRTLLWFPPDREGAYTIPASIPRIGAFAFYNAQITSLTIPDSVTSLGEDAISACQKLEVIELGIGVTELTDSISASTALREYRVSPSHPTLEVIDGVLFQKEPQTLISYPPSRAGDAYVIPEGTRIVSSDAFSQCRLKAIECPSSLQEIRQSAITWCSNLVSIILNDGLETMSNSIYYCEALTEITLPDSLRNVEANPITYCNRFKTIRISKDHPYLCILNNALVRKSDMFLVCYPALNTRKYTVPEGVRGLAFGAFGNGATLEEVILPEGVESIESVAFLNCPKLRSVTLPRSVSNISWQGFMGLRNFTLNVPAGSYAEEYAKMYQLPYKTRK